jgi:phospholipid-binding lipoprotein MlaA
VTRTPSLDKFEGVAEAGIESVRFGEVGYSVKGAVNVPIATDKVAVRVTGYYTDVPGYIDNPVLGQKDFNGGEQYGVRGVLLLKPVAVVDREVIPDPLRTNVRNFLTNLRAPVSAANDVLQGDFKGAGDTAARFLVNSTLGFGGLADVAAATGKLPQDEDFGQTLAVWGVGEGPYLVLPLYGPSNVRDVGGFAVDSFADPVNRYLRNNDHDALVYARIGVSAVDARSRLIEVIDDLKVNSIDYYATVRSLYRQRRNDLIRDGVGTGDEFPVFEPARPSSR